MAEPIEEEKEKHNKLKSVLEMKSMEEFLSLAELSEKTFEAEKMKNVVIINENTIVDPKEQERRFLSAFYKDSDGTKATNVSLRIPRRPKWDKSMKREEIRKKENEAFIQWRKSVAESEEKNMSLTITPFEKNIDIWRQLWQVIERSQVILQIVDARNPLFYRCSDFEQYVLEVDPQKICILLINKADFLSQELIDHWKNYFDENKIKYFFFSAKQEQAIIDEETTEINASIVTRTELLKQLKEIIETNYKDITKPTIGMVGYPNVGKSSVINVLCGKKKVSVSAQPGKTKHFQTINIESDITLCDCPGLVFPSFTNSKAEMMCGGVISIDQSSDFSTPMILLTQRIPRKILEEAYKLKLPEEQVYMSSDAFLHILARERGDVTGSANPDMKRTAKMVLKDYVSGKLLYCHLRPDYDITKHGTIIQSGIGVPMITSFANEVRKNSKTEGNEVKKSEDKQKEDTIKKVGIVTATEKAEAQDRKSGV